MKIPEDKNTPLPEEVLELMASAMLEPSLGREGDAIGNGVRKTVLKRALKAAETAGWRLSNRPTGG